MVEESRMGDVIDGDTLRFLRAVPQSCERVWRAITDERELAAWMRYPVRFEARQGGRVQFFDEPDRIVGRVFIFDPPRTLAFSFADVRHAEHVADSERDWSVRWDLEPAGDGCRITFVHRGLGGAHLWGLGEGWQGFIDQLEAYFDGTLDALAREFARRSRERDTSMLSAYRLRVSRQLLAWGLHAGDEARRAVETGDHAAAQRSIDRLGLAARQLARIARQQGARPDYSREDANPVAP